LAVEKKSSLTVLFSSMKMAVATFLSRIMGLVREQVMAALFGASGITDAFLVAYRIPNLMRDLFAEGAFSAAFVPTFVEAKNESKEEAHSLLKALIILLFLVTGMISAGIFVFAEELIILFAPKFQEDPAKFQLAINLTKLMSPYLCLVSLAALYMGALNSLKVFFIPALAPVFFNISMIGSMLFFPQLLEGMGYNAAYALGIGVTFGGILQGLIQLPKLFGYGFVPGWPKKLFSRRALKVFQLLGPGLLGFAATQINLIVTTILASGTVVGAVSWLGYSFRLFQLPIGILSVSIGNSNLVHFSDAWKSGNKDEAVSFLSSSFYLTLLTILPAMVVFMLFGEEIVHIIFERGRFTSNDTQMTGLALQYYAWGLPAYALVKVFVPAMYTLDKHKMAVASSIISIAFNIVFCLRMVPQYGFYILALGTTLSVCINATILSGSLKRSIQLPLSFFISLRTFKLLLAAIGSAFFTRLIKKSFDYAGHNLLESLLILLLFFFLIAFSYVLALYLLGERKLINQVLQKVRGKLKL
jgi:putative peptidoglycan lipid II flippase